MIRTAILNVILSLGVSVMVVTPLVWAILTQHRDHVRSAATDGASGRGRPSRERRRLERPHTRPVVGRM